MDFDEFQKFLDASAPPPEAGALLQALWYDATGDWTRAHQIVQAQGGKTAAAVHAYLHRKEGDLGNADYWYERSGGTRPRFPLEKEWRTLVEMVLAKTER